MRRRRKSPSPTESSPSSNLVRINKLLSELGLGSRREVETLVRSGRVTVDGKKIADLSAKFPRDASVVVDGSPISRAKRELFLFHKPRGVVTTMADPQGRRCIADFTKKLHARVFPVGRLDQDVCGLLLLTNDGDFAQSLLHPKFEVEREYVARVKGVVDKDTLFRIKRGFSRNEEFMKALRCSEISPSEQTEMLIGEPEEEQSLVCVTVAEGSKHFVKRLLEGAGHPVVRLARIRFGRFWLGDLHPGELKRVPLPETESARRPPRERKERPA